MKFLRTFSLGVLTAGLLAAPHDYVSAQSDADAIDVARIVLKADRQDAVTEAMQFTESEGRAFWPIYHQYRAEMDKVGDEMKRLVLEYARYYPDVPDDNARKMLKDLLALEKKQTTTRASYLKKIGKVLSPSKTLRFAQVESRLDLAVRLQLAANIPLVPVEGKLTGDAAVTAVAAAGVPGGVMVKTYQLSATVASIDKANRKVTLVSPDGFKQTVKAGPEVVNFDQIEVGDQLKVTATEELVVQMAEPGAADDGAAGLVALAPEGAKPGGLMANTVRLTATVQAIDAPNRTATLQFPDGTTRTFPVRDDVDLSQRKVGEKVTIRSTESLAISMEEP